MNFTAQLPNGMTKDVWIASLKPGDTFCTRRPMKGAICGKNSLQHNPTTETCKDFKPYGLKIEDLPRWQPLLPKLKAGKKYAICSGRGTKAICSICGHKEKDHEIETKPPLKSNKYSRQCYCGCYAYTPLSCELLSVQSEEEWRQKYVAGKLDTSLKEEAEREGFEIFSQLDKWITDYYGGRPKMWRYCFRR